MRHVRWISFVLAGLWQGGVALSLALPAACTGQVEGSVGGEGAAAESRPGDPSPAGGERSPPPGGLPTGDGRTAPGGGAPAPDGTAPASCPAPAAAPLADTPLRRLTRTQYANTVRDLLGPALGAAAATKAAEAAGRFPADEKAGPFASNAVAAVSDAHGRLYMDAAALLADAATEPKALAALLPCQPTAGAESTCAEQFIRSFARRAFRRPPTDELVAALKAVYMSGAKGGGFAGGIGLALQAMLQAPDFLYHVELKPAGKGKLPLDAYEVAARLSYFLWDSMPDETLFAAAAAGQLTSAESLRKQAERLLADNRSKDALARFASDWLGLEGIEALTRDPKLYPQFSAGVPAAMKAETTEFVDQTIRRGDGSLTTLLTGSLSAAPDPLLKIYGVTRPFLQSPSVPLQLPKDQRAGVLTQASVLAMTSHTDHTSPVKRGVFLLDNLLCHEIAFPDGLMVPPLPEPDPKKTTRERFVQHTREAACAVCHTIIDPLGFALERYDAIGVYRDRESGGTQAIDDTGTIKVGDPTLDGPVQGGVVLATKLAGAEKVRACMTRQVRRFALGRLEQSADACALARLQQRFATSNYNLRELMLAVSTDESFRLRPATTP